MYVSFHFTFRQIGETRDVRRVIDFIAAQDLGYPNYDAWVQKTEAELLAGGKQAVIALSDTTVVGDIIYQEHKVIPELVELKNVRVHPDMRMRAFGGFMLKQIEIEAQPYKGIILDTRTERTDLIHFLQARGYEPVMTGPLYDPNEEDITFMKALRNTDPRIITTGKEHIKKQLL